MPKRKRQGTREFPKRSILWLPFDEIVSLVSADSPTRSTDLLTNYFAQTGAELPVGATIGLIRGIVSLTPAVVTVFQQNHGVQSVLQLVPEGGRTQIADPDDDILDAMWYGQMMATNAPTETASGVFHQFPTVAPFVTKAMRKITGNGQQLIASCVQTTNADYDMRFVGNVMVRLP